MANILDAEIDGQVVNLLGFLLEIDSHVEKGRQVSGILEMTLANFKKLDPRSKSVRLRISESDTSLEYSFPAVIFNPPCIEGRINPKVSLSFNAARTLSAAEVEIKFFSPHPS